MSVRATKGSLASVDVEIIDERRFLLQCKSCGQKWSPMIPPNGGRMHRGWWICPNNCNQPKVNEEQKMGK